MLFLRPACRGRFQPNNGCLCMLLTEILQPDCIKVPLEAAAKQEAIYELVDLLCQRCDIEAVDALKRAVWDRETTRTTGIGHGIAIPHGKAAGCPRLCMAIGRPAQPIDFGAIDNKPVELIILLASAPDQTGPHIQALARISQMLTQADILAGMMSATTADQIHRLIEEHQPAS